MFFVAIEGIDASGKATQTLLLKEWLMRRAQEGNAHLTVLSASFPDYDSHTGRAIKAHLKREWSCRIHRNGEPDPCISSPSQYDPLVFQSLQTSNRLECLPKEAWTNPPDTILIADRYHASALVYGSLDGLPLSLLDKMNQSLPMPDRYILLDVPVEKSIERRPERRDRYEADIDYMRRVREQYKLLFASRPGWIEIDGSHPVLEVHYTIRGIVEECLRADSFSGNL